MVGYSEELKVAFNREIGTPSVTLEGDIFQPSGLLTGGSRKGGGDLLRQLHALAEAESELCIHQKCLSEIEAKIKELLPLQKKFKELKAQLELKSYYLSLFQSRAEQNEHHKVKRMEMEQKDCSHKVDKLIERHAWISSEKHLIGRGGTYYDFVSCDPSKAINRFEKLQLEQSGLEKRVNKKVMAMFEKAKDEYNDLISKKNIIE